MLEPHEELANAIIELAVKDYRKLAIGYHRTIRKRKRVRNVKERERLDYQKRSIRRQITELEKFFRSKWFSELTSVSGEMVISRLREEYQL